MSKNAILDEVLFIYDMLETSNLSLIQIYSEIKKNREQKNIDVGNFECLKSYIHWSILDNLGGRGKNIFTIKIDGGKELVNLKLG